MSKKSLTCVSIRKSLRSGAAAGYDNVSMTTVKQTIGLISITNVINISIN